MTGAPMWLALGLAAWFALAVPVGLVLGRIIRRGRP